MSYIDNYEIDIFCSAIENERILKRATYSLNFKNPTQDIQSIKDYLEKDVWMVDIPELDPASIRKLTSIKLTLDGNESVLNSSDFNVLRIPADPNHPDSTTYKHLIKVKLNANVNTNYEKEALIEITEERITPSLDVNYVFRTAYPTKNYGLTYNLKNLNYKISGNLFGTMIKKRDYRIVSDDNSIYIRCNQWMLNGNGVVITVTPS